MILWVLEGEDLTGIPSRTGSLDVCEEPFAVSPSEREEDGDGRRMTNAGILWIV